MSLGEFFDDGSVAEEKYVFRAEELSELGSEKISFLQVGAGVPGRQLQILRERYEPQGDTGEDMLSHAGEEGGLVLSGEIEITVGGQVSVLSAGDGYLFDSNIPHRFRNLGDEECEIISACTPPTF